MKNIRYSIPLLFLFLISATSLFAQQVKTVPLYEVENNLRTESGLPDYQINRQYVRLNPSITREGFLNRGDRLTLPTGGETSEFRVERISRYTADTYSVIARSDDGKLMTYTVQDDRIRGNIHMHDSGQLYHMAYDPVRRSNYFAAIDYGELDIVACPGHLTPDAVDPDRLENFRSDPLDMGQQIVTVDLLIMYTNKAEQWMIDNEGSVNLYISEVMNRSQLAIDNSEVEIELRLVHTANTSYDEDIDQSTGTTLSKLQNNGDGNMDEAHTLRDAFGADLVALIASVGDVGGIAYIMNSTAGSPAFGFSVNRVQQLLFTYTFVHELGHNMGNHHSRNQNSNPAPASGGLHEYSTGWRWTGTNGQGYVSVMTYDEGDQEAPHFSNPDISFQGVPTGSYSGQFAPADNARSMNEIRGVLADYRDADNDPRPSTPIPNSPQNGATGLSRTPNLAWGLSADAENYTVQVSTSTDFSNPIVSQTTTNTAYRLQDPLDYLSTYYWRVRASNAAGDSDWSSTFSFTTIIQAPANVTVTGPGDGAFQVPVQPTLDWDPADRAAQYQVEVSTNEDFSEPAVSATTTGTSYMPVEELQFATIYHWRVRAVNEGGTSDWSAGRSFTTVVNETKINMNYPNPFRGSTTIQYQLAEQTDVLLEVYDSIGRKVYTLVDGPREPKVYNQQFDASRFASGVYMVRLVTANDQDVLNMTLVK